MGKVQGRRVGSQCYLDDILIARKLAAELNSRITKIKETLPNKKIEINKSTSVYKFETYNRCLLLRP
jgi:hypothetical protein